jgi:protein-S-isoprenylcysteine O-methyltransferase Ste14
VGGDPAAALAVIGRAGAAGLSPAPGSPYNRALYRRPRPVLSAINRLFNDPALRRIALKSRYLLMLALLALIAHYARREWLWPGIAISFVGALIQTWSFGALVKNEQLTARGPYVLVRNPMYLGRFVMLLGMVLLLGNPYLAGGFALLYYFYMVNRVAREERRLGPLLGEPYREYCRRTNRFWPAWSRLADPALRFMSWEVLVRNNGQWNLLGTLLAYVAIATYVLYLR